MKKFLVGKRIKSGVRDSKRVKILLLPIFNLFYLVLVADKLILFLIAIDQKIVIKTL